MSKFKRMKSIHVLIALVFLIVGYYACDKENKTNNDNRRDPGGANVDGTSFYAVSVKELPACTEIRKGNLAYLTETKEFIHCDGKEWTSVNIAEGPAGPQGPSGTKGLDGQNNLILTEDEPAGAHCATGGKRIQSGLDNGDGSGIKGDDLLQSGEVDVTSYVCHGAAGAAGAAGAVSYSSLIKTITESAGGNCASGGKKIQTGLDNGTGAATAGNHILEDDEVEVTSYICNGAGGISGATGVNSLIKVTAEPVGVNCTAGGKKVDTGLDNGDSAGTAANAILEAGEVDATTYVCNGINGTNGVSTLILSSAEAAGVNCANGGKKIQTGLDNGDGSGTAGNSVLEVGEVDATSFVCDGINGSSGSAGSNGSTSLLLITAESAGANCTNAGKKVQAGLDNGDGGGTAGNSVLEAGEVDSTAYVCNGANGSGGSGSVPVAYDANGNKVAYVVNWEGNLWFGDGISGDFNVFTGKLTSPPMSFGLWGNAPINKIFFGAVNCTGQAAAYDLVSRGGLNKNALIPIATTSYGGVVWNKYINTVISYDSNFSYQSMGTWDYSMGAFACDNFPNTATGGGVMIIPYSSFGVI